MASDPVSNTTAETLGDQLIFPSGREVRAHGGVIGICRDLGISHGWDGGFDWVSVDERHSQSISSLTDADMLALADLMISRWTRFKAEVLSVKGTDLEFGSAETHG